MSRAAHPMFRHLVQAAGTHGQLMLREQQLNTALLALGGGLGRVGLGEAQAWDRLLESPLAEPAAGGALQALLAQLAQRDEAPVEAAEQRRSRTPPIGPDAARASERRPTDSAPTPVARKTVQNPFAPRETAARAALKSPNTSGAPSVGSAAAANAAWQQRALRAGLQEAFFTPVRAGRPPQALAAGRADSNPARDAQTPSLNAPSMNAAVASFGAQPNLASLHLRDEASPENGSSVLPRLNSALDRIDRRSATAGPTSETPSEWRRAAPVSGHVTAATEPGRIGSSAAQAATAAVQASAALGAAALKGTGGGLRGLAARAASMQAPSVWPELAATAAGAAAAPDTPMQAPTEPRSDRDEQLAEQLARVLKREAERDGIDVSDVMP